LKIDLSRFAGKFKAETLDNLARFDRALVRFERSLKGGGEDFNAATAELTRIAHTVKGAARMLKFYGINNLCHALEELLVNLRKAGDAPSTAVDLIIEARRGIEKLLSLPPEAVGEDGSPFAWLADLYSRLQLASEGKPFPAEPSSGEVVEAPAEPVRPPPAEEEAPSWRETTLRVDVETIDDILVFGREMSRTLTGLNRVRRDIERIRCRLEKRLSTGRRGYLTPEQVIDEDAEIEREINRIEKELGERTADVDQFIRRIDSDAVELRMRSVAELYDALPLQVRDLTRELDREVTLELKGGEVKLDGRIVDVLGECLIHIIRNCVDHGIEPPQERIDAGKPRQGRIEIHAVENGGWARVVVSDDGRGIDPRKTAARAVELGLVDAAETAALESGGALRFIFDDRFSSRGEVTDISGRGVGLSAVKKRLRELRGDITAESTAGRGARFILTVPTSLSSQSTLVTAIRPPRRGTVYVGVPTTMVRAVARLSPDGVYRRRDDDDGGSVDIPVLSMSGLLFGAPGLSPLGAGESYVIEVSDGERSAVLAVERVVTRTEAVIEPLPAIARGAELIAGSAPMTPERIMLILNVPAVMRRTDNFRTVCVGEVSDD